MNLPDVSPKPILTQREVLVFDNPWWRVYQDEVMFHGEREGTHMRMRPTSEKPGVVALVTRDTTDGPEVLMVSQWRYAQRKQVWELPRGFGDPADSSPQESAAREIAEETGLRATDIRELGELVTDSSIIEGRVSVFLVKVEGEARACTIETDDVCWVKVETLQKACAEREVCDSFTIAALGLAMCDEVAKELLFK